MTIIKRPAKKITSPPPKTDPNKETDQDKMREILSTKKTPVGKAKKISKVISVHFSVGDEDRNTTMEQFIEKIMKMTKAVPYGDVGMHATKMSEYYIIDGVVCLPIDYDPKKQQMKTGHFPPPWAGGPVVHVKPKPSLPAGGGMYERKTLSKEEYDKKYKGLGAPGVIKDNPDNMLESFDWDDDTINDEKAAKSVADKAITNARRKLKIKKAVTPPPTKRVIKRKAK